ncbi:protein-glutamine glutaminase family protein [Streptomyces sp. NPDC058469]|uniref:protein-glutamine glutaminase family protein n=1 Tax=Streptomyces sp. NPDC058469 TaxID=3346514 RepID=UPI003664CC91
MRKVAFVAEENLLGARPEVDGAVDEHPDGYSSATHEIAGHLVYDFGLTDLDRADVEASFDAKRERGVSEEWADGPRQFLTDGTVVENRASKHPREYFAQTVVAYLGMNAGRDPHTGLPRSNGAEWVAEHEEALLPLFQRLFGKPTDTDAILPANPVSAARAEEALWTAYQAFVDRTEDEGRTDDGVPLPTRGELNRVDDLFHEVKRQVRETAGGQELSRERFDEVRAGLEAGQWPPPNWSFRQVVGDIAAASMGKPLLRTPGGMWSKDPRGNQDVPRQQPQAGSSSASSSATGNLLYDPRVVGEFTRGPAAFLRENVVLLRLDEGMRARMPGSGLDVSRFLTWMNGKDRHWFGLTRDPVRSTADKPVYLLTPAVEKYVEEFGRDDAALQGIVRGHAVPAVRGPGNYVAAHYVPYLPGSTRNPLANIGHADIPVSRIDDFSPDFVFTAAMNGCALVVTEAETEGALTVWHYQSPNGAINGAAAEVFRGERRPLEWFAYRDYMWNPNPNGLPEATNMLWRGPDGWEILSQANHTGLFSADEVGFDGFRSRKLAPGREWVYVRDIHRAVAAERLEKINESKADADELPKDKSHLNLLSAYGLVGNEAESDVRRLEGVRRPQELLEVVRSLLRSHQDTDGMVRVLLGLQSMAETQGGRTAETRRKMREIISEVSGTGWLEQLEREAAYLSARVVTDDSAQLAPGHTLLAGDPMTPSPPGAGTSAPWAQNSPLPGGSELGRVDDLFHEVKRQVRETAGGQELSRERFDEVRAGLEAGQWPPPNWSFRQVVGDIAAASLGRPLPRRPGGGWWNDLLGTGADEQPQATTSSHRQQPLAGSSSARSGPLHDPRVVGEFTRGPAAFLRENVVLLRLDEGMRARMPGSGLDVSRFLTWMNGKDQHWFGLTRDPVRSTADRPVYLLTPAVEKYVEEFGRDDAALQGIVRGHAVPAVRGPGNYVAAHYVPYLPGSTTDPEANIGHADIPVRGGEGFSPDFVFTAAMNGCALVVTEGTREGALTVWHYQSPNGAINGAAAEVFRGERRPLEWFGFRDYMWNPDPKGLPEATNMLWRGPDGWEILSQANHTGLFSADEVGFDGFRSRKLAPGREWVYVRDIHRAVAAEHLETIAKGDEYTRALKMDESDLNLASAYGLVRNEASSDVSKLEGVRGPQELLEVVRELQKSHQVADGLVRVMLSQQAIAEARESRSRVARRNNATGVVESRLKMREIISEVSRTGWLDQLEREAAYLSARVTTDDSAQLAPGHTPLADDPPTPFAPGADMSAPWAQNSRLEPEDTEATTEGVTEDGDDTPSIPRRDKGKGTDLSEAEPAEVGQESDGEVLDEEDWQQVLHLVRIWGPYPADLDPASPLHEQRRLDVAAVAQAMAEGGSYAARSEAQSRGRARGVTPGAVDSSTGAVSADTLSVKGDAWRAVLLAEAVSVGAPAPVPDVTADPLGDAWAGWQEALSAAASVRDAQRVLDWMDEHRSVPAAVEVREKASEAVATAASGVDAAEDELWLLGLDPKRLAALYATFEAGWTAVRPALPGGMFGGGLTEAGEPVYRAGLDEAQVPFRQGETELDEAGLAAVQQAALPIARVLANWYGQGAAVSPFVQVDIAGSRRYAAGREKAIRVALGDAVQEQLTVLRPHSGRPHIEVNPVPMREQTEGGPMATVSLDERNAVRAALADPAGMDVRRRTYPIHTPPARLVHDLRTGLFGEDQSSSRLEVIAGLSLEHRRWLAVDPVFVGALAATLEASQVARVAAALMVEVPVGTESPLATRYELERLVARMLVTPDIAAEMLLRGTRLIALPRSWNAAALLAEHSPQRWQNVPAPSGRNFTHRSYPLLGVFAEETINGVPEENGRIPYPDGMAPSIHEMGHLVHYLLAAAELALILDMFQALHAADDAALAAGIPVHLLPSHWPNGVRQVLLESGVLSRFNYSAENVYEFFAELVAAWMGMNFDIDPFTRQPRNNGRQWVIDNMPAVVPLLTRLFGPGHERSHEFTANPLNLHLSYTYLTDFQPMLQSQRWQDLLGAGADAEQLAARRDAASAWEDARAALARAQEAKAPFETVPQDQPLPDGYYEAWDAVSAAQDVLDVAEERLNATGLDPDRLADAMTGWRDARRDGSIWAPDPVVTDEALALAAEERTDAWTRVLAELAGVPNPTGPLGAAEKARESAWRRWHTASAAAEAAHSWFLTSTPEEGLAVEDPAQLTEATLAVETTSTELKSAEAAIIQLGLEPGALGRAYENFVAGTTGTTATRPASPPEPPAPTGPGSVTASRKRRVVREVTVDDARHETLEVEPNGDCFFISLLAGTTRQLRDSPLRHLDVPQLRARVADWLEGDSPEAVAMRATLDSGPGPISVLLNDLSIVQLEALLGDKAPALSAAELARIDRDLARPQYARELVRRFTNLADRGIVGDFTAGAAARLLHDFTPDPRAIRTEDRQRLIEEARLAGLRRLAEQVFATPTDRNKPLYAALIARYPSLTETFPKLDYMLKASTSALVVQSILHTDMWMSPFYDRVPHITATALDLNITVVESFDPEPGAPAFTNSLNPKASQSLHVFYQDGNHYSAMNRVGGPAPATAKPLTAAIRPSGPRPGPAPRGARTRPELAGLAAFLRGHEASESLIGRLDGLSVQGAAQLNSLLQRSGSGPRPFDGAPGVAARESEAETEGVPGVFDPFALRPGDGALELVGSLVEMPAEVRQPVAARMVLAALAGRVFANPEVAERVVAAGVRIVVVPRDRRVTDLPGYEGLSEGGARHLRDGRPVADSRGLFDPVRKVAFVAEENLLGARPEVDGAVDEHPDGYSSAAHEMLHPVYDFGLTARDREGVEASFDAKRERGKSEEWADGPRLFLADGTVVENYGSGAPGEHWVQTAVAYLGMNAGRDPHTGLPRNNGPAWVAQHEPGLLPLLQRLFGKPTDTDAALLANPASAARAEDALWSAYRSVVDRTEDGDTDASTAATATGHPLDMLNDDRAEGATRPTEDQYAARLAQLLADTPVDADSARELLLHRLDGPESLVTSGLENAFEQRTGSTIPQAVHAAKDRGLSDTEADEILENTGLGFGRAVFQVSPGVGTTGPERHTSSGTMDVYAKVLGRVLKGRPVQLNAVTEILRRSASMPGSQHPFELEESYRLQNGSTLADAVVDAVADGRLTQEYLPHIFKELGLARDFTLTAPPPQDLAVPPGMAPGQLKSVRDFAAKLHELTEVSDAEGTQSMLRMLDGDLRKVWAVQAAWTDAYGSDLRTEVTRLWAENSPLIGIVFGTPTPYPVPLEQLRAWYGELARLHFEHHLHGPTPVLATYPEEGCFIRAHLWSMQLMQWGVTPRKIFAARTSPPLAATIVHPDGAAGGAPLDVKWNYHVAPLVETIVDGQRTTMVLDPALRAGLLTETDWLERINAEPEASVTFDGTLAEVQAQLTAQLEDDQEGWDDALGFMLPVGEAVVVRTDVHAYTWPGPAVQVPDSLWTLDRRTWHVGDTLRDYSVQSARSALVRALSTSLDMVSGWAADERAERIREIVLANPSEVRSGLLTDHRRLDLKLERELPYEYYAEIAALFLPPTSQPTLGQLVGRMDSDLKALSSAQGDREAAVSAGGVPHGATPSGASEFSHATELPDEQPEVTDGGDQFAEVESVETLGGALALDAVSAKGDAWREVLRAEASRVEGPVPVRDTTADPLGDAWAVWQEALLAAESARDTRRVLAGLDAHRSVPVPVEVREAADVAVAAAEEEVGAAEAELSSLGHEPEQLASLYAVFEAKWAAGHPGLPGGMPGGGLTETGEPVYRAGLAEFHVPFPSRRAVLDEAGLAAVQQAALPIARVVGNWVGQGAPLFPSVQVDIADGSLAARRGKAIRDALGDALEEQLTALELRGRPHIEVNVVPLREMAPGPVAKVYLDEDEAVRAALADPTGMDARRSTYPIHTPPAGVVRSLRTTLLRVDQPTRLRVIAELSPVHRRWLAVDPVFVGALAVSLESPQVAGVAAALMVEVPAGAESPLAARYELERLAARMLVNPDVATQMLLRGTRLVVLPRSWHPTELFAEHSSLRWASNAGLHRNIAHRVYPLVGIFAEENILGQPLADGFFDYEDGHSPPIHEMMHLVHYLLTPAELALIEAQYQALHAADQADKAAGIPDHLLPPRWPNGVRQALLESGVLSRPNYSTENPWECFAEAGSAWMGTNVSPDPYTRQARNNGRLWVTASLPSLVPLLTRLFGPGHRRSHAFTANPINVDISYARLADFQTMLRDGQWRRLLGAGADAEQLASRMSAWSEWVDAWAAWGRATEAKAALEAMPEERPVGWDQAVALVTDTEGVVADTEKRLNEVGLDPERLFVAESHWRDVRDKGSTWAPRTVRTDEALAAAAAARRDEWLRVLAGMAGESNPTGPLGDADNFRGAAWWRWHTASAAAEAASAWSLTSSRGVDGDPDVEDEAQRVSALRASAVANAELEMAQAAVVGLGLDPDALGRGYRDAVAAWDNGARLVVADLMGSAPPRRFARASMMGGPVAKDAAWRAELAAMAAPLAAPVAAPAREALEKAWDDRRAALHEWEQARHGERDVVDAVVARLVGTEQALRALGHDPVDLVTAHAMFDRQWDADHPEILEPVMPVYYPQAPTWLGSEGPGSGEVP